MTVLLNIPSNYLKAVKGIEVIIFGIKISTRSFITRLLKDKLNKTIKTTRK